MAATSSVCTHTRLAMLVPDISFNPSAGIRNDSLGDISEFSTVRSHSGALPHPATRCLQLSIKEVLISGSKETGPVSDVFVVTVVTDNRAIEPVRLRVHSFGNVHANQYLALPASGLLAYRQQPNHLPSFMDYRILVIEGKTGMNDLVSVYQKIITAPKYISVRDILANVARVAPPSASLIRVAADIVLNLAARTINPAGNGQLLYVQGNFDKKVDDMGVRYGVISQGNEYASIRYQVEKQ